MRVLLRARKSVLISEPQSFREWAYYPYLWAVLKTHCESTGAARGWRWLDPIFGRDEPERSMAGVRRLPDVLGLSCYSWNWDLQCRLARWVKDRKPDCLVVAGGPHPDSKDPEFFRHHPYIDAVVVKDGELPFARMLEGASRERAELERIPGLYLPNGGSPDGGDSLGHHFTGPAEVPVAFEQSPYLRQSAFFERLRKVSADRRFDVIWETNRGCPYACNFCDWGSNTMSKVRRFDLDRVLAEIDWFARMEVENVLLADANFGILPRDVEIAEALARARSRHGYPRFVHYSPAKNHPDRTVEISRILARSSVSPVHTVAVQHTDPEVLASADRANISVDRQREVVEAVVAEGTPTLVQLIVGIPGDSYERWKDCLGTLMEWGLHDNYQIFDYALLPNAPAADPRFAAEWELRTITRDIPREGTGQRALDDVDGVTPVTIVTGSKSFSPSDWVRMKAFAALVRALHNFGLTRWVAIYLYFTHGVRYRDFYEALIEEHFGGTPLYQELVAHLELFLHDERATEELELRELPEARMLLEPSRWAMVRLCLDFERQFDGIEAFLLGRFAHVADLASALDYQRRVVVLPSDGGAERTFSTDHDWLAYFERARRLTRHEPLAEPERVPGAMVTVEDEPDDRVFPMGESGADDETARWLSWMGRTQEVRRTLSANFTQLRLETNGLGASSRAGSA